MLSSIGHSNTLTFQSVSSSTLNVQEQYTAEILLLGCSGHLPASPKRNAGMKRLLVVTGTAILVAIVAAAVLPPRATPSIREFDADRIARLELSMWQAYYDKERVRLFGLLVVTLREQFHFSWATATSTAFRLARAAARFGDAKSDYDTVLPDLTRAYEAIKSHSDGMFDPSVVARAELAWWVARRVPGQNAPEQVGQLIAREYADMYDAPIDDMARAGLLRAQAGALRDAEAGRPDWRTIARLLQESYQSLHATLSSTPASAKRTGTAMG